MAIKSQHVIKTNHLTTTEENKITTGPAKQVADNIVGCLYLTSVVPVDDFRQPGGGNVLVKQGLDFAGHRCGGAVNRR